MFQDGYQLVLSLPAVNHQWQTSLHRPSYLLFESQQLFLLELATPVEVESNLSDGNHLGCDILPDLSEYLAPVGTDLFWMQTKHRIAETWMLPTKGQHSLTRLQVDARDANRCCSCLTGTGNNGFKIILELLTVQVAMGIDEHQLWRFIISAA